LEEREENAFLAFFSFFEIVLPFLATDKKIISTLMTRAQVWEHLNG
jgi:hypothetical protein